MDQTDVRTRIGPPAVRPGWWLDLVLLAAFAALTVALARGHLLALDQHVADWVDLHRPAPLFWLARVLNFLGQGGWVLMPLAILLAALVTWRRRSVRPLVVFGAAFVLTSITIGPLKIWLQRAAPHFQGPDKVSLFNAWALGDKGQSYPSGHVVNALVWYGVIALLASALLRSFDRAPLSARANAALRVLPPAVVLFTTTYLGYHWVTDSVAGLVLGLILTRLMARVTWDAVWLPPLRGDWARPAGLSEGTR
jgi:membrane-associated phospholipid phosphatase